MKYTGTQRVYVRGQDFIVARSAKEAGPLAMELKPSQELTIFSPHAALDDELLPAHWFSEQDLAAGRSLLKMVVAECAAFFEGRGRVELTMEPPDPRFDPVTGRYRDASS